LAIPPAWTHVWICPSSRGHIQATGRDDRGRKQYRYHPRWREVRDATKFYRMIAFGEALPAIRARVTADLSKRGLPREKVLATVVRLLESTCIRVGNEEYKKANGSFGLTTLRDRHVRFAGSTLTLKFTGKGGAKREVKVRDRRLARIVRQCEEIPGYELFQYWTEDGEKAALDSADVNEYLASIAGDGFTAKDFRTWMGSVHALSYLCECGPAETEKEAKKNVLAAIDHAAEQLCNTRAVCRRFYVHPRILECYAEGTLGEHVDFESFPPSARKHLDGEEVALLKALRALTNGSNGRRR
jgi:DNA topoisomerase-1